MHDSGSRVANRVRGGKPVAVHNKRVYGQPQYVSAVPDRIRYSDDWGFVAAWNAPKTVLSWAGVDSKQQTDAFAPVLPWGDGVHLCGRNRPWKNGRAYVSLLLVGLFVDTASYHKIYVHTDKHAIFLRSDFFHGLCAGTVVHVFCRMGRWTVAHRFCGADIDSGSGFFV